MDVARAPIDLMDKKISKTAIYTIIKNYGQLKGGGQAQGPPLNTPLHAGFQRTCSSSSLSRATDMGGRASSS